MFRFLTHLNFNGPNTSLGNNGINSAFGIRDANGDLIPNPNYGTFNANPTGPPRATLAWS